MAPQNNPVMKMIMKTQALVGMLCSLAVSYASRADSPIVQTLYTADPAPVVINDEV